jgi:excisionase family DNA binding protein
MNDQNSSDRFLKLKEVQNLLGVSRTTLWRWQAEHGLKVVRVGDVVRIRESDLQAFLKRHETVALPIAVNGPADGH